MSRDISFNIPYFTGKELEYIGEAILSGKVSGDGGFTKKCHSFFEARYSFEKVFLTTSCTDALEMAAILLDIKPGDEVIVPSYTFVSTANAFVLRGAKIVFADSYANNPNIDPTEIARLITPKTRAIVPVHYAGVACDMDGIMDLASKHDLFVVEDAAQAIESTYKGKTLGSIGHLGAFSFHQTKNIISGEGGMITVNDKRFIERAEIIREKGTNRGKFLRGEIDLYEWVDMGSSFLPSDVIAAMLYAQLEHLDAVQSKRKRIWQAYYDGLIKLASESLFELPYVPEYASNNASLFYLVCKSQEERRRLIGYLKERNIHAAFHFVSLQRSDFYRHNYDGRELPNSDKFSACLLRLPFYFDLRESDQAFVIETISKFYKR